jgi:phenylacetic acid degradation operon negative regulatory protein
MKDEVSTASAPPVRALLRHFRAQRPLRAGSLLITLFGDAIAPRGGAVTLGSLIRLAAAFGLTERLVRTSVARLAREGWLVARRTGRRSEYRLTRLGAERFAEATQRIYGENPRAWDGQWTLLLLPATRRPAALRRELKWLGFGQLTPALCAHPGRTPPEARALLRNVAGANPALLLQSTSGDPAADRELVARGWDLEELARRYRRFLVRFDPVEAALAARAFPPETAFVVRTLLIHEYRKIHLRDPLLPPALLPHDWVGASAYELCRRLYARVFPGAEEYLATVAHQLQRPLPAANSAAHARFGGVGTGPGPTAGMTSRQPEQRECRPTRRLRLVRPASG